MSSCCEFSFVYVVHTLCVVNCETKLEMAERLDTMSSVKLGKFRSKLVTSCVSSHTGKL